MKKLVSIFLCVAMIVTFMPAMAFADSVDDGKPVQLFDKDGKLKATEYNIEGIFTWAEDGDTVNLVGDTIINKPVDFEERDITINGNGNTIKVAGNFQGRRHLVFNVGEESTLIMNDVTVNALYGDPDEYAFGSNLNLIAVYSGGKVECNNCNFKNNYGSAVNLEESLGSVSEVTLKNCEITGNEGYGNYSEASEGTIGGLQAVTDNHAAVTVGQGGKCTIDGGSIHDNTGLVSPALFVHSDGEAVIKGDARIYNNTATKWGSAIGIVGHGKVTMDSGEIKNNSADEHGGAVKVENYEQWGEGTVTPGAGPATFIMNGGTIAGNTAKESTGGIHAFNFNNSTQKAVIEINGGTITGNTVENGRGPTGCIREGAVLKLSGSPSIDGAIYVENGHDDADDNTVFSEPIVKAADGFSPTQPIELDVFCLEKNRKAVEYPEGVAANSNDFNLNVGEWWGYYWTLEKDSANDNFLVFWPQRAIEFKDTDDTAYPALNQFVNVEGKITKPSANLPIKDGYVIEGWYKDKELKEKWNFDNETVKEETGAITLYAKWTKTYTPGGGGGLSYTVKADTQSTGGTISPAGETSITYGGSLTYKITPDQGYVIKDVIVDGKSLGAVSEYTFKNVREAHSIKAIFERDLSFLDEIKLQSRSKLTKKKHVTVRWKAIKGSLKGIEGYEVFRSLKFNSGYGKKPFFETKKTTYTNNKSLKKGKRYYYKVRGYVTVDGVRYYTKWSLRAWRTIR